jgi:SAM-dependent methyltransferase
VYRRLVQADVAASGLDGAAYDMVTACLVDEHLRDLGPLYKEVSRLTRPAGLFVLVGFHPQFIMLSGMPTHFDSRSGEPLAIETYVHPLSEHVSEGLASGLRLMEMKERFIDERWLALKPKWRRFAHHPISFAMVWRKGGPEAEGQRI